MLVFAVLVIANTESLSDVIVSAVASSVFHNVSRVPIYSKKIDRRM